jgi:hypothetical protein
MLRIPHCLDNRLTVNCEILATCSSTYSPVRTSQEACHLLHNRGEILGRNYFLCHCNRTVCDSHSLYLRVPDSQTGYSPLLNAKIWNTWNFTSTSPHFFNSYCLTMHWFRCYRLLIKIVNQFCFFHSATLCSSAHACQSVIRPLACNVK